MVKLILQGELGQRFGTEYTFHVKTLQKALKLMEANFKGFFKYLQDSDQRIAGYEVVRNGDALDENSKEFYIESDITEVTITPLAIGAGANSRIVAGVLLVAVGAVAVVGTWGGGTGLGYSMIMSGVGLIAGGIAEKMSKTKIKEEQDEPNSYGSYIFSGATNTAIQGTPVYVGYGKMLVGSIVISAALSVSDYPI